MISFAGTALTGDLQGKLMFEQQPMKMAAAEAACHDGTGFSVLSVGNLGSKNCDDIVAVIEVPGILSFLAKGDFTTEVKGVNSLLDQYKADYGTHLPDNPIYGDRAGQEIQYVPVMEVTYWGFRMMIGFGGLAALAALVALWADPQGHRPGVPRPHAAGRRSASWPRSAPTPPAGSSPKWAASRSSWRPTRTPAASTRCSCSPPRPSRPASRPASS